jgi:4,5-dihydroxyphthalate decarboxylase
MQRWVHIANLGLTLAAMMDQAVAQGAVREVYRLLKQSEQMSPKTGNGEARRFGVEAVRQSLETIIDYSVRQELIPRRFAVDELFNDVTRRLA